ncbi:MAG: phosphoenolpyruvate--protein phosphotransferase [Candidatus Kapaibacteriales bacterium]
MSKFILKGISSSIGFAKGKAFILNAFYNNNFSPSKNVNPEEEIDRFNTKIKGFLVEFDQLFESIENFPAELKSLLYPVKEILSDPEVVAQIIEEIKNGSSVEKSVQLVFDTYIELLKKPQKSYSLKKAYEIELIKNRILELLNSGSFSLDIPKGAIIVATSITPEQLFIFKLKEISGIITEFSGLTAHTSILARSLKIPEIIGVSNATISIHTGDNLLLDAYQGTIIVEPDESEVAQFNRKIDQESQILVSLGSLASLPTKTKDSKKIALQVNINLLDDLSNPVVFYSDGIGLVRTEHLIGSVTHFIEVNDYQTLEEEQFKKYYSVAQKMYPKEVIFRFFDYGADKSFGLIKHFEPNPMLGFRGIRYLLSNERLFRSQVRAFLRASVLKNVKIMLPMITTIDEIKEAVQIIKECLLEFINLNLDVDANIKVGVMIETPAAALISDYIAKYVDFFSIGTNDLTQYTIAADRENPKVVKYFDPFHPAVLKMMKITVESAKKNNKPVGICGELASHPSATKILIGLGLDSISVTPNSFLQVKKWISEIDYQQAEEIVNKILEMETFDDVRQYLAIF